jgi:ubiquinone/menaquinone biosynthesis C-methylase UbiE
VGQKHKEKVIKAFSKEIEKDNYNVRFQHSRAASDFFLAVITDQTNKLKHVYKGPFDILECGMGTGYWLELVIKKFSPINIYGFDLPLKWQKWLKNVFLKLTFYPATE